MAQKQEKEDSLDRKSQTSKRRVRHNNQNQRLAEGRPEKRQKKDALKITDFFTKVQGETSNKRTLSLPTPDKQSLEKMDVQLNVLAEEEVALLREIQSLKEANLAKTQSMGHYLKKLKTIILGELKKIYEIKRTEKRGVDFCKGFFKNNGKTYVQGLRQMEILQHLERKQKLLSLSQLHEIDLLQRKFIEKQISRLRVEYQQLKMEKFQYKYRMRLAQEELSCIFAKEGWPMLNKKYQILQLIGKGGFSEVYRAFNMQNNKFVAVKLSSINGLVYSNQTKEEYMKHIIRECQVHQELRHPCIAQLLEIVEIDSQSVCIILEYCQGPDLQRYLKSNGNLEECQAKTITRQLFSVLKYLNELPTKIIHYDIKPQNIMFHQGKVKILDFGLCKAIENQDSKIALTSQGAGTYWYLPPETFSQKNAMISNKVDVWSLGIILYEMLFGCRPFGHDMTQNKILKTGAIRNAQKVAFPQNVTVSSQCKQFIAACLELDQLRRIDPSQACRHPYLAVLPF